MKLKEAGERALVELASKIFGRGPKVEVGIGDDGAAISIDDERCLVATTDMLTGRADFPPGAAPEQMGRKAAVANLSDLAAMGAEPLALIFSVGLPGELDVSFVKRMMRGMDATARRYGAYVVGGDLGECDDITIAGAAFGFVDKRELLTRSGAEPGDAIAVTGRLGAAAAGLALMRGRLPREGYERLVKAQLEPVARVREGRVLAGSGHATSAIDITDGLASDLWRIARSSGVKLVVDRAKIPVHPLARKFAAKHGFDAEDFALFGGEDFELLLTLHPKGLAEVELALRRLGTKVTQIGHVSRGRGVYIKDGPEVRALPDLGYEHFKAGTP